jgi:hypothetical protein
MRPDPPRRYSAIGISGKYQLSRGTTYPQADSLLLAGKGVEEKSHADACRLPVLLHELADSNRRTVGGVVIDDNDLQKFPGIILPHQALKQGVYGPLLVAHCHNNGNP